MTKNSYIIFIYLFIYLSIYLFIYTKRFNFKSNYLFTMKFYFISYFHLSNIKNNENKIKVHKTWK